MRRFINADDTDCLGADGGLLSYNLFAYCDNNPVMGYDPEGTWNWGGVIAGVGIIAATIMTVATFGIGTAAGAVVAAAAITTGATMVEAAATDSTLVLDISGSASDGNCTVSGGLSLVMDFDSGNTELYAHMGTSKSNSTGITYSTGIISNYNGYGTYGGPFSQGGISVCGIGINHCFDPDAEYHKNAFQATTITFSSPMQSFGYSAGVDYYYTPIKIH